MAVLDFVAPELDVSVVLEVARGNIGSMLDIQADAGVSHFFLVLPDVSNVLLGTAYGQQGVANTGTLVVSGGGATYYAY